MNIIWVLFEDVFCNVHKKTPVLEYLFNKIASLKVCNFIQKTLLHRCFPVNIVKYLRTAFFTEHLQWLLFSLSFSIQLWLLASKSYNSGF